MSTQDAPPAGPVRAPFRRPSWSSLDAWLISQGRSHVVLACLASAAVAVAIALAVCVPRPTSVWIAALLGVESLLVAGLACWLVFPSASEPVKADEFAEAASDVSSTGDFAPEAAEVPATGEATPTTSEPPTSAPHDVSATEPADIDQATLNALDAETARADARRLDHARQLSARGQQILAFAGVAAGAGGVAYARSGGDDVLATLLGANLVLFGLTIFCALGCWRITEHSSLASAETLQDMAYQHYSAAPFDFQKQLVSLRAEVARRSVITQRAKALWARLAMTLLGLEVLHLLAIIAAEPHL